jgi:protein-S-isoprenylcysteine O-methyltransferase Ste14
MLKAISIIGCIGMSGGLLALFALRALFSAAPVVIGVQVASALLLIWARITFGWRSFHLPANPTVGGVVRSGPYRYIRHPIYTAVCVLAWAGIAAHLSLLTVACGALVTAGALVRIFAEERLVTARYPEYADYAAQTWRMVPFVF